MSSEVALQFPQALKEAATASEEQPPKVESVAPCTLRQKDALSDEELLESVGKGDKHALNILFYRHGRAVLNIAWRILRDESEAYDLRQEVFLYLFERAKGYDSGKSKAASWIMQITYHRALDRKRFLSFRQHYKVEAFDEERVCPSFAQPLNDQLDGKGILDNLRGQLSPEQRRTLELHFFEGYSFREIAEQSGQTVGNIRHHYYRALDRLRSNLFSKKRS